MQEGRVLAGAEHLAAVRNNGSGWGGELPDSFKYRYDPVAKTIKQRDTYPQVALVLINMAARLDVPRPTFLTRSRTQLENRSSARIERGGGPTMADG